MPFACFFPFSDTTKTPFARFYPFFDITKTPFARFLVIFKHDQNALFS
jgi:hypothetical protein